MLYVDDILLASSDINLLLETKKFLSCKFHMKDLGEASYVLGIEIHRDRSNGILGLSQKIYILRKYSRSTICTNVQFCLLLLSRVINLGHFNVQRMNMKLRR